MGDLKKGNREGGKTNPSWSSCGQWTQALGSSLWSCPECAPEWSSLIGAPYLAGLQLLLFSPGSNFRMADYVAMGGSPAMVGKCGGRRERYTAGKEGV